MALCWSNVSCFFILGLLIYTSTAKTTLSTELTNFVPACARDCFISFLDSNYATPKCGTTPKLDCLCKTKSTSGFTVGEGAAQCIFGGISISSCDSDAGEAAVAGRAYLMCNGKEAALPNTHGTLRATIVTPTTSSQMVSTSNFSATTAITASTTSDSVLTTSTTSFSSATNVIAPTPTDAEEVQKPTPNPTPAPALSKQQVIGITVGSIAGGAVGVTILIIVACWKSRKARKARDSDMLPFQLEPSNSLNYGHGFKGPSEKTFMKTKGSIHSTGSRGPGGTSMGLPYKTTPRIPPRLDTTSPHMFSRRSIVPDMIGVAISPDEKQTPEQKYRRKSKLLPEKPNLVLHVPAQSTQAHGRSQPAGVQSAISRQSTATQFEEDFDSADTAVNANNSWIQNVSEQQPTLPMLGNGNWQTIRPVNADPAGPAPAFFVTGGNGNHWRPGQASTSSDTVPPEYYVKPLNLTRGPVGSFSQPRRPEEYPARSQVLLHSQNQQPQIVGSSKKPKLQLEMPMNSHGRQTLDSASTYDPRDSVPVSAGPRPNRSNSNNLYGIRPNRRSSYRAVGPYDSHQSTGSLTSFETLDSAIVSPQENELVLHIQPPKPVLNLKTDIEARRRTQQLELSPVVESPPSGKSPVSYPKIPARGRLPEGTINSIPPPRQPDFASVLVSGRAVGSNGSPINLSPIVTSPVSAITPMNDGSMKPWRLAELQAQRERERQTVNGEVGMVMSQFNGQLPQRMQSLRKGNESGHAVGQGVIGLPRNPSPRTNGQIHQQQQQQQQQQRYHELDAGYGSEIQPRSQAVIGLPRNPSPRAQQQHGTDQSNSHPAIRSNTLPAPRHLSPPQPVTSFAHQQQQPPIPSPYQPYQPYNPYAQQARPTSPTSLHLLQPPARTSTAPPSLQQNHLLSQTQHNLHTSQSHPNIGFIPPTRSSSQASFHSQTSTTSSLFSKRRGTEKNIALNLNASGGKDKKTVGGAGWKVLGRDGKDFALDGELPRTPGWVPKLTPTRRGDELFLSVA